MHYHSILDLPPPTNAKIIQQREKVVKEVYTELVGSDTSAIVLTGITGVGKSTLASLVYQYAEEQRYANGGPFSAQALWLKIEPSSTTIIDLAGTLFEALDEPMSDLGSLSPQEQAVALLKAMNEPDKARLVIIDQFDSLLDSQTGRIRAEFRVVARWLNAMNSRICASRFLLTSCRRPQETYGYPLIHMKEFLVEGLEENEGIDLLRKQEVHAEEVELRLAVTVCEGHALALTHLASLLHRNRSLSLSTVLEKSIYTQFWMERVGHSVLGSIYKALTATQHQLLWAFSLYRDAVPLEAAMMVIESDSNVQMLEVLSALDALLAQHLLQARGEDRYQLHVIVAKYAQSHIDESDARSNQERLRIMHEKAAKYYLQVAKNRPQQGHRRSIEDLLPLIEAAWQQCMAEQWQEAYDLLEREGVFTDLRRWGDSVALWDIYKLLLSANTWYADPWQKAHIYNNMGQIYIDLGDMDEAKKYCEHALDVSKEQGDPESERHRVRKALTLAELYSGLAQSSGLQIFQEEARRYKEETLRYGEQAATISEKEGNPSEQVELLNNLGLIYNVLGLQRDALAALQKALSISEKLEGDLEAKAITLSNLGGVYNAMGQKDEALQSLEKALTIYEELLGKSEEGKTVYHLGKAMVLNSLGLIYDDLEEDENAQRYLQQALDIRREEKDLRGQATTLNNLGGVYTRIGLREDALKGFNQALQINQDMEDRWREAAVLNNLGKLYHDQEKRTEAKKYLEQALQISRAVGDHGGEATILNNLGEVYSEIKQKEQAFKYIEQAWHIYKELGDRTGEGATLHNLGILYFEQGKDDVALACFLLARKIFKEVRSPSREKKAQHYIEALKERVNENRLAELAEQPEPQVIQFIEQTLKEGL